MSGDSSGPCLAREECVMAEHVPSQALIESGEPFSEITRCIPPEL